MHGNSKLSTAKSYLENNIRDGLECPCCSQWAQEYKYSFHSGMVLALIHIYQAYAQGKIKKRRFFHVERYLKDLKVKFHGYHSKLKFWGLIEQKRNRNPKKKYSGFWRLTPKGEDFVKGITKLPKYVWLRNGVSKGFSGPDISITDVKANHFDYAKMMAGTN